MEILNKIKNLILKMKNKENISQTSGVNQDKTYELELSYLFSIFNCTKEYAIIPGHIVGQGWCWEKFYII